VINSSKAPSSRSSRSSIAPSRSGALAGQGRRNELSGCGWVGIASEQLLPAFLLLTGPQLEPRDELSLSEPVEGLCDLGDRAEPVQSLIALL
jgi:hypothetical protein